MEKGENAVVYLRHTAEDRFDLIWKESAVQELSSSSDFEPGGRGYNMGILTRKGLPIWTYWGTPEPLTPDFTRGTTDIPGDHEWDAVQAAISTWNNAGSVLNIVLGASQSCEPLKYDGTNCIGWVSAGLAPDAAGGAAAWTCEYPIQPEAFEHCDERLNEFDVAFNDGFTWSLNPLQDLEVDVQGVATHELGHFIPLLDLDTGDDGLETMYRSLSRPNFPNLTLRESSLLGRTLFWGDIAGIRYAHPREYTVSPGQWIGDLTQGGDFAIADLFYDGYPELIFLWVDADPAGPNKIYYRIGYDLNGASGEVAVWQIGRVEMPGSPGDETQGAGLAIADIDRNGIQDLLVAWVDNPPGDNKVYYRIGWDIVAGEVSRWGSAVEATGGIGHETDGLGVALEDIDNDGNLDMYFSWVDDATYDNGIHYNIRWDVQPSGESSQATGGTLLPGSGSQGD